MNKFFKRFLCGLTAVGVMAGACAMSACGGGESYDETKSHLWAFNYAGGWGSEWLEKIKTDFETDYAETEFEPGKKGVQVHIFAEKTSVADTLKGDTNHIYFATDYDYNDLAANRLIAPITDVVTTSLSDVSKGSETGTIEDKLDPIVKEALTGYNGEYYAIPFIEQAVGITYDEDLFVSKSYFLKAKADGSWCGSSASDTGKTYFTKEDSEKTVGPNGVRGDYDDGLPATLDEFKALVARIESTGVAPFIWSGKNTWYTSFLGMALWASLSGADQASLAFNFGTGVGEGVDLRYVSGFNGDTPIIETTKVTPETGYLPYQSEALYYASDMLKYVLGNDAYRSTDWTTALTHMEAQRTYIYSNIRENKTPIAMLMDGDWWYNEASESFEASKKYVDEEYAMNRNFKFMPMPTKISGGVPEGEYHKPTITTMGSEYCYINGNIKDENILKLAKTFAKYVYLNKNLVTIQSTNGATIGVNYDFPDEKIAELNTYSQSYAKLSKEADAVYMGSAHPIFVNNTKTMSDGTTLFMSNIGNEVGINAFTAFKTNKNTLKEYFLGLSRQSKWENDYSKWLVNNNG